jgi:hypothetical protein
MWDHSAMNPDDPEQYIRHLERGVSQTPETAPFPPSQPFGTPFSPPPPPSSGSPFSGQFGGPGGGLYSGGPYAGGFGVSRRLRRRRPVRTLILAVVATIVLANVVYWAAVIFGHHFDNPFGTTTVNGNLIMENSGAKETIACNDGDLKLDGDNNSYTITGHCRRLEVFGSANHVTVDSADTISAFGDDNAMIYHSGSPEINKTGNNNTVAQG